MLARTTKEIDDVVDARLAAASELGFAKKQQLEHRCFALEEEIAGAAAKVRSFYCSLAIGLRSYRYGPHRGKQAPPQRI